MLPVEIRRDRVAPGRAARRAACAERRRSAARRGLSGGDASCGFRVLLANDVGDGVHVSLLRGDGDTFRTDPARARAAFREQELEQVFDRLGIGGVPEKRALAAHRQDVLALEALEVMGERGRRNVELGADVAGGHSRRMRGQQEPDDAQARFGAHRGEHVGKSGDLIGLNRGHETAVYRYFYKYQNIDFQCILATRPGPKTTRFLTKNSGILQDHFRRRSATIRQWKAQGSVREEPRYEAFSGGWVCGSRGTRRRPGIRASLLCRHVSGRSDRAGRRRAGPVPVSQSALLRSPEREGKERRD